MGVAAPPLILPFQTRCALARPPRRPGQKQRFGGRMNFCDPLSFRLAPARRESKPPILLRPRRSPGRK